MIDLFKNINEEDKNKIFKELESSTYKFEKNKNILSNIKSLNLLGYVLKGSIQVIKIDYNGNRIIVDDINQGNIFGDKVSFIMNTDYQIVTKEESEIVIFDYIDIINYPGQKEPCYNQFIKNLLDIMYKIIVMRNERIRILTQKTIRNKLLEYFDIQSKRTGSRTFRIPFTFTDLADYLAVDRSAMTREIKHLKEERIIEVKSRRVTIIHK